MRVFQKDADLGYEVSINLPDADFTRYFIPASGNLQSQYFTEMFYDFELIDLQLRKNPHLKLVNGVAKYGYENCTTD